MTLHRSSPLGDQAVWRPSWTITAGMLLLATTAVVMEYHRPVAKAEKSPVAPAAAPRAPSAAEKEPTRHSLSLTEFTAHDRFPADALSTTDATTTRQAVGEYALDLGGQIELCQALGPAAPCGPRYVDCAGGACGNLPYSPGRAPWQEYAQGEYVGHYRTVHVPEYRLRVDDLVEFVFRLTREQQADSYRLNIGDQVRVESFSDPALNREALVVQPDGKVTLRLLGEVRAAGKTIMQLRDELERLYTKYYKEPAITVTPIKVNTRLEDLRDSVLSRFAFGGQVRQSRVIPDGTISLPAVGVVPAQGLTLSELKAELDARYAKTVEGIEVMPVLLERAPRTFFVLGEVRTPGRYTMTGPTTLMQAVALAGGWNVGANLRNIIIFRRGDDWRLMASRVDMWVPLMRGEEPCPAGELWLNDSDIVLVPKMAVLRTDEWIDLIFTRGVYRVVPLQYSFSLGGLSTL